MLRKLVPVAVPIAAILFLSACAGTPDAATPDAATPQNAPPPTATQDGAKAAAQDGAKAAAQVADTGVRLRLDTTDAEEARLWEVWKTCMFANGGQDLTDPGPQIGTSNRMLDVEGSPKAAHEKCQPKKPLPPVELDEKTNPRYAEQWKEMVQCLRKNGLKVSTTKPGEWTYDDQDGDSGIDVEALQDRCTLKVFGGRK
ncbi:hypothetical protein [Micromonospora sp. NBC_01412]|uniref:hypothetical protein n=1 Tax=Micromonospora sp. NBC_01412 TaxID=2903590 RepID=UPI00325070E5